LGQAKKVSLADVLGQAKKVLLTDVLGLSQKNSKKIKNYKKENNFENK